MVKKFPLEWYLRFGTLLRVAKIAPRGMEDLPQNLTDTKSKISASMLLVMYCTFSQGLKCPNTMAIMVRPGMASFL